MTPQEHLDVLRAEAVRFAAAAGAVDLATPVPTCPGWDVAELVRHLGSTYHHKLACMRLGRSPADGEWPHQPPPGVDVLAWYADATTELVTELTARDPAEPTYTWFPADRTVGFWHRRMAHETVVHRLDAELAGATPTPLADAVASDAVDEMLRVFLGGPWWEREPVPAASGRTVALRAAEATWRVGLHPTAVTVEAGAGAAAATLTGRPVGVLLWVWGREPIEPVDLSGDPSAAAELRERLALVSD